MKQAKSIHPDWLIAKTGQVIVLFFKASALPLLA